MLSVLKKYYPRNIKIVFALLLIIAIVIFPPLGGFFVANADAGTLTSYKVQINNSQAGASGVTYQFFWTTSVTTAIKQINISVCTTPSGTCTAPTGFSSGSPTLANDNIAGSGRTTTGTANTFQVVVTTPAAQSTQAMDLDFTGITNPTTVNTTYYVRTTTYSDAGTTVIDGTTSAAFAVLNTGSIAVTASVDPNFTFTVARAVTGTVNNDTINVSSTADNSIPFGTLNTTTASVAAHDITITTNAANGYTVTASTSANAQAGNPPLISGSTNHISNFTGTNASPTTWSAPNGSTPNTNTGFFGYTTEDATLCTGTNNRFTSGGPKYAGFTTSGVEITCSATPISSRTVRVGWKLAINTLQPAGAYTGTIILVATPTY